ncbi:MAG: DNA-directed RNA polymerase subunit beta' [Erythrobacter sp.]|nr:DNA-directed RNA polymerase subunit beta' [Erythrobacter sp.]
MTDPARKSATTSPLLSELAAPRPVAALGPVAARFVHSLRLIALHERVGRDPVPELAVRLGGVEIAARALAFSQAIAASWPENVHVSRFCCCNLTHDEVTIGALVDCAWVRDRKGFEAQVEGLVRPDRIHRLWEGVLALVAAEARAL